jgi:hypothetical protein
VSGRAGVEPAQLLAGVVEVLFERAGAAVPGTLSLLSPDVARLGPATRRLVDTSVHEVDDEHGPDLLGDLHEALLTPADRHRSGAYYTSRPIADGLTAVAMRAVERPSGETLVCDPAAGGGAFLLAAARRLTADGQDPADVVEELVWGADVDPLAASVASAALLLWSAVRGAPAASTRVVEANTLVDGLSAWDRSARPAPTDGFDILVGNPPFQGQLGRDTARTAAENRDLRGIVGDAAVGYADTAALFLGRATEMVRPGGAVALVQPHSLLVARDARPVRHRVLELADLVGLWWCVEPAFDAGVRVCAPVLRRRSWTFDSQPSSPAVVVERYVGPTVEPFDRWRWRSNANAATATWAPLVADLLGVPAVELAGEATVRSLATATAGFRDQYYGLTGHIGEAAEDGNDAAGDGGRRDRPRLITSGLIEPGTVAWGRRATTFARQRWQRPVVRLDELDARLRAWAEPLLAPKLVVATQTKVLEAAVDEHGTWWPSVPVIAVVPSDPADVWRLAAVLLAPPVCAWAWARHAGGALGGDAIKLAAREVLELPLPTDPDAWDRGAEQARILSRRAASDDATAALLELGAVMCDAYRVEPEPILSWWSARLPGRTS